MENKVMLLYGEVLPPFKHIEKILNKYGHYYLRDMNNKDFKEDNYYAVMIEEGHTGLAYREPRYAAPVVPVKKEYLSKFLNIFKALNGNMCLCKINHEHPIVWVRGVKYEGYCYYLDNGGKKVLFMTDYGDDKGQYFAMRELDWYKRIPKDKRWIQIDVNENTEKAFLRWLKDLIPTEK
ncbi:hypothetical protein FQ087_12360 [Sporosarcina sp. ANT_H38]|uniref:hypothetical protein n=1 Tax=Sporosarcina sp. ANT_H38 TaxID=2597358 RepID=UPI0011F0EF82|nr:hypothetical protein [Sporosarcina sp. ANT_H38]KAA0955408.1 hypothetical protein FQ087_12360 [Sporosarcina sp. ANT_H38]